MSSPKSGDKFRPGQIVLQSGIYRVIHYANHVKHHEATCVYGKEFPSCNHCGQNVRFVLKRGAQHLAANKHFKISEVSRFDTPALRAFRREDV
jgi:hypothetical protein